MLSVIVFRSLAHSVRSVCSIPQAPFRKLRLRFAPLKMTYKGAFAAGDCFRVVEAPTPTRDLSVSWQPSRSRIRARMEKRLLPRGSWRRSRLREYSVQKQMGCRGRMPIRIGFREYRLYRTRYRIVRDVYSFHRYAANPQGSASSPRGTPAAVPLPPQGPVNTVA